MTLFRTLITLSVAGFLLAGSGAAHAQAANRASHVDFDDQLIQGQVNKGAVHLIERRDADLGSLVKVRKNYRKEILEGAEVAEPDAAPAALVAAIPASLPSPAAVRAVSPAPMAPAMRTLPVVKPTAKAEPAKKIDSKLQAKAKAKKGQAKLKIGGSRVLSRR